LLAAALALPLHRGLRGVALVLGGFLLELLRRPLEPLLFGLRLRLLALLARILGELLALLGGALLLLGKRLRLVLLLGTLLGQLLRLVLAIERVLLLLEL